MTSLNTQVTAFMKALDKAKYDAILADVTNLINIGQRALNEIKSIIQSDSSTAFKNKYNNINDENNLFFYTWKSLKNGYEGFNDGTNLKPGSPATITKIKAVYAKIKAIEDAGKGTPRYPVTEPRDGGIIVQVPSEVFVNIFIFDNVFATTKLNDVYGNKAITDSRL